jgi:2-polyprenyl-6-methoxyphenol hydroxylase-like FAD-dependent oxidoreductase
VKNTRVLISGASIAGPSLAYWLSHYGFDVTVVERAVALRRAGQAVDFKGPIHMSVLRRMGILDDVKNAAVPTEDGLIIDASGRKIGVSPGAFIGGDINIPRGDLSQIIYELTADKCEYIFGESITSLHETTDGIDVTFAHGSPRTFDLVFGADGMHSNVRKLAFGPETEYVHHLGYYYVLADLNTGSDQVMYSEPGRTTILGGSKASAFLVFASDELPPSRDNVDVQKQQVIKAFAGGAWRIPELMAKLPDASEFYLDSISRATVDRYSRGRVALLGDSAWGNALGGFGTGLAMVGAYVLAGELHRADGDYRAAFGRYESAYRDYASVSEKINGGQLLAPVTRRGIRLRNFAMTALSKFAPLIKLVERPARVNLKLEDYEIVTTTAGTSPQ